MKVWELGTSREDSIYYEEEDKFYSLAPLGSFNGEIIKKWEITKFSLNKGLNLDTVSFLNKVPVFSRKAINSTGDLLDNDVQILPIQINLQEYYLLNVTCVIDCFNYEKSLYRTRSNGTIRDISKYVFHTNRLDGQFIYKTPEEVLSKVFVTDKFRDRVIEQGLTGFSFRELFDSEEDPSIRENKRRIYHEMLEQIEQREARTFDMREASKLVEEKGIAVASGKWKWQKNRDGIIVLGELTEEFSDYTWMKPTFIPPILIDLKWKEVEKSDI
ncbi:imm11 family protein [Paenibacillus wynnii]|uniref:Immunity MXAN-0049 protein domain-containing protein n=1 Tax=Paenibacillus wynnii TaxID=268407 RepID=A0A098M8Y9_9BACL|nr:DUF1629 domain-containing protein [Paenibacillus wynnii]KGE19009.1 hypothetical protein PWYN_06330 [Paenibacillus wynnii]